MSERKVCWRGRGRGGIGGGALGADQLGTHLGELALGAELGSFDTEHFAGIPESQRPRRSGLGVAASA